MRLIFGINGIPVYLTGLADFADPAFTGFATKGTRLFHWSATPIATGYCIECTELQTNRQLPTVYETPTYNLGLEISAYINRNA